MLVVGKFLINVVVYTDTNWFTLFFMFYVHLLGPCKLKSVCCVRDIFSYTLITLKIPYKPNILSPVWPLWFFKAYITLFQKIPLIYWICEIDFSYFGDFFRVILMKLTHIDRLKATAIMVGAMSSLFLDLFRKIKDVSVMNSNVR